jgi:hypothetical protein
VLYRARERHSSLLVEETRLSDLFSRALDLKQIGPETHSDVYEILWFNVDVAVADFNCYGWPDVVFRNQYGFGGPSATSTTSLTSEF